MWSSAHQTYMCNREERKSNKSLGGIPRITLPHQQRSFFSTSAAEGPEHTFRERMEAGREKSREVASKGAHSLRDMVRRYGAVFIGTYFTVYFTTLGVLFLGIESGALDPLYVMSWVSSDEDMKSTVQVVTEFMDHYPWTRPYVPYVESNPEVANLAVAWIAVKFTEPIRFGATVAIVPRLARYLGYAPAKDSHVDHVPKERKGEKLNSSATNTEGPESAKK